MAWGRGGTTERDTLLYRRAPNQLGTDGGVSAAPATAPTDGGSSSRTVR